MKPIAGRNHGCFFVSPLLSVSTCPKGRNAVLRALMHLSTSATICAWSWHRNSPIGVADASFSIELHSKPSADECVARSRRRRRRKRHKIYGDTHITPEDEACGPEPTRRVSFAYTLPCVRNHAADSTLNSPCC